MSATSEPGPARNASATVDPRASFTIGHVMADTTSTPAGRPRREAPSATRKGHGDREARGDDGSGHRTVLRASGAALVLALLVLVGGSPPDVSAVAAMQADGNTEDGSTYDLVDVWEQVPWELTPGRYGEVGDITSTPDGSRFLLDTRDIAGRLRALHQVDADGTARSVIVFDEDLTERRHVPARIDAGFGGTLHVLSSGSARPMNGENFNEYRVWKLAPDGEVLDTFEAALGAPRRYVDIAVRDDGRIYLVRQGPNPWCVSPGSAPPENVPGEEPQYGIDVFDPDGALLETIVPEQMRIPTAIDVARDGTIYVPQRIPTPCSPTGGPGEPQPTARPSDAGGPQPAGGWDRAETDAIDQASDDPINGVIILEPDHAYRETVDFFGVDDVGVGPAGVFVSRNVEIFELVEDDGDGKAVVDPSPVVVGPTGHIFAGFLRRIVFNLDVPQDGRLLSGMNHCYFQGLLTVDDVADRPSEPRLDGAIDAVELEGPAYPIRVAAADELAVLLGRMQIVGSRPDPQYRLTNYTTEAQTVQRWSLADGVPTDERLRSQVGLCPDADIWFGSDSWITRDIAVDGSDVYTIDPELLQLRADDAWPAWTVWPGFELEDPDDVSFLVAVAAGGGRAAVLDVGAGTVVIASRDGRVEATWPVSPQGLVVHPVDIALGAEHVYVADQSGRIVTRDLEGDLIRQWPTHDGPRSIALGPDGDVFVLGRGGFGFQYRPDGTLVASWQMPRGGEQPGDISVGADGRVFVSFTRLGTERLVGSSTYTPIERGGVWVFERTGRPLGPPPPARACVPRPDKWAAPDRIPLGSTVDVSLTVEGWCPGRHDDAQIMIVFDTSRSMLLRDSIGQGRLAALSMLESLDPARSEVGLVTFDFGPTLLQPLTSDLGSLRRTMAGLEADGDTQLEGALEAAYAELTGRRGNPDARQVIVIVTDGVFKDPAQRLPPPIRADILDAGIQMHALVYPSWEFRPDHVAVLEVLLGNPDHVHMQPEETRIRGLTDNLTGYTPEPGLFERITVVDKVPDNMAYIEGSAAPAADWAPEERTLTWTFGVRMADEPLRMTYTVRPMEVGTWPTNVWARGPYRDALGNDNEVEFPVPVVEVYDLANRVYLPYGFTCPAPRRADIALVMDASSSMLEQTEDGRTKIDAARDAAATFLESIEAGADRVAIIEFFHDARILTSLTGDPDRALAGLAGLAPAPDRRGTRIDLGLSQAREALAERRPAALPVVVLLTDGLQNPGGPDPVIAEAERLRAEVPGVVVYAIGLGPQIDADLLRDRVAGAHDRFFISPTAEDLEAIYAAISERLGCG